MIKSFYTYISEALDSEVEFSLNKMMDFGVWTPNDDVTKDEKMNITSEFYKAFPAGNSDEGDVLGYPVSCVYGDDNDVHFYCFFDNAPMPKRIAIVKEIVDVLLNVCYSVAGGDKEIKKMLMS